ncbi:MAG: PAS domain S-box protein [Nitrospiraceae bacterium]|nr:MAG: PAS domain S-box protein [Nitrospiraceae bacterium]
MEEKFHIIFESVIDGILLADAETMKFLFGNPAISHMLGYSPEEIKRLGVMDIHPEADLPYVIKQFQRQSRGEIQLAADIPVRRRDGSVFYADITSSAVRFDGRPYLIGIFRDVTERRLMEEALLESEAVLMQTQRVAALGHYVFNARSGDWTSSDVLDEIFGIDSSFTKNVEGWLDLVHPEDRDEMRAYLRDYVLRDVNPFDREYRILRANGGAERWLHGLGRLETGKDGKPERMIGTIQDVTDRKNAEEALIGQEKKYRTLSHEFQALLDNIPDGIVHLTPDLRIIWANKSLIKQAGRDSESELKGRYCYEAFWSYKAICNQCSAVRSFSSGKFEGGDAVTPDGRILEFRAAPISGESGKVESVIEIIRDITGHRKLEEQLRHAQKMEAVGTLAGGIAHDFNNILSAIIGYTHLIQIKIQGNDQVRHCTGQILEASNRAAALTQSLLSFGRKQPGDLSPVDLNEVIKRFEKFLLRVIREDIILTTAFAEDKISVMADSGQIEQVIMNLVTNARDAMPEGGKLGIATRTISPDREFIEAHGYGRTGKYALIAVSDTGTGMDESTRPRIFEPFFTTKEQGKGTGLGLSMVYGIINRHNGFIDIHSETGKGTTFNIYLPLAYVADAADNRKPGEK